MVTSAIDRRDALHGGQQIKHPCRVAAISNITLSGLQTIDGVPLTEGDANLRVLVTGQTDTTQNGIYNASSGAWERAKDFNGNRDVVQGTLIYVLAGTTYASTLWRVTTADPVVIGTSSLAFAQYPSLVQDDLNAIEALVGTSGLLAKTAANSWALRTLTAPAAGITVSNGTGAGGNPTLGLANDLGALEGLSGTGLAARTGTDSWAQRTITAGAGITVTNGSGASGNPTIALASGRVMLLADTTFYVRTDGVNSSTVGHGLVDGAGTAFLTPQFAHDHIVANYDFNQKTVTIQVRSGTYSSSGTPVLYINKPGVPNAPWIGGGTLAILGDTSTPANVLLTATGASAIQIDPAAYGNITINGFELRSSNSFGLVNGSYAVVAWGNIKYGACETCFGVNHPQGKLKTNGTFEIAANATQAVDCEAGVIEVFHACTVSGTPAFARFARVRDRGKLTWTVQPTGSATGPRFEVSGGGVCDVDTGGLDFFPGNTVGTVTAPGAYIGSSTLLGGGLPARTDTAGVSNSFLFDNFGVNAADQGIAMTMRLGTGGVLGGTAATIRTLSTEDWSTSANRSAKLQFSTLTDDAFTVEADITKGMTLRPAVAITAGGNVNSGYKFTSTANFGMFGGSGAPTISAAKGSLYLRSDGSSTSTRAYINTDGGTTWTAITTAA